MPDDTYRPQSPDLSDFSTISPSVTTTTTTTSSTSGPSNPAHPGAFGHSQNSQSTSAGYSVTVQEEYRPRSPVLPPSFNRIPLSSYRNSIPDYSHTYNYSHPQNRTQSQPYIPPIPSHSFNFSNYQPPLPLHSHFQPPARNIVQRPLQEKNTYAFPPHIKPKDANPSTLDFASSSTTHSPQSNMARTTGRVQTRPKYEEPADYTPEMYTDEAPIPVASEVKMEHNGAVNLDAGPSRGIEVKTKFPVARIKRIMQADEEVGKVAQVTPVAVSKALELFMISLVSRSADLAKSKNSKRVTAQHLKAIVDGDEQFDFLNEVVAKVAEGVDAGGSKRKPVASESEDEGDGKKKKRAGGRKKKEESA